MTQYVADPARKLGSALSEKLRDARGEQVVNQPALLDVKDLDAALVLAVDKPEGPDAQSVVARVFAFQLLRIARG